MHNLVTSDLISKCDVWVNASYKHFRVFHMRVNLASLINFSFILRHIHLYSFIRRNQKSFRFSTIIHKYQQIVLHLSNIFIFLHFVRIHSNVTFDIMFTDDNIHFVPIKIVWSSFDIFSVAKKKVSKRLKRFWETHIIDRHLKISSFSTFFEVRQAYELECLDFVNHISDIRFNLRVKRNQNILMLRIRGDGSQFKFFFHFLWRRIVRIDKYFA